MFKFLKKLFTGGVIETVNKVITKKQVLFDSSVLNELTKNYKLNLDRFENDWITGNGFGDYQSGLNHEWYSPESVVLVDESIELRTTYKPNFIDGERFEYRSGRITSTRSFGYGYLEFNVELPKGCLVTPMIELLSNGETITVLNGCSDKGSEYQRFTTEVYGKEEESDVYLHTDEISKIGCYITDEKIEIYYNDILVRREDNVEEFMGEKVKVSIRNSHSPKIEGIERASDTVMSLVGLTYYRKK